MEIEIIGTGSSGNCFLFNDNLIVDMGLPKSKMKDIDFGKIKYVLLTHIHADHFLEATIRYLSIHYPKILFICGEWLKKELLHIGVENIKVIEMNKLYEIGDYKISGIIAYHDVENCGYRLMQNGHKHIYITDTSTLEGITAKNYDTATIECNHDFERALEIIEEKREEGEFSHLVRTLDTHLSVQQTIEFCKGNNIKKLIPVHIGDSTRVEVMEAIGEYENNKEIR